MTTSDTQRPLIEFPCPDYPVKILGDAFDGFTAAVLHIVDKHAELCATPEPLKPSRNGRFVSLTVKITATGEAQLRALNEELKSQSFVKMVL